MVSGDGHNVQSSTEQSVRTTSTVSGDSRSHGSIEESEDWDFIRSSRSDFDDAHFNPQQTAKKDVLKNSRAVQELTINKLNYKGIRLVGREQEISTLTSCIDQASSPTDEDRSKHFVLIQGYSGVGKSSLVAAARAHVKSKSNSRLPQMAHGKFDQQNYDEPYSGIASVFEEICVNIQSGVGKGDGDCMAMQTEIRAELESEIKLLQKLLPTISDLVGLPNDGDTQSSASGSGSANRNFEADFERLKFSFRVLTRILSSKCSPLIFVLDNLQWSDMASLRAIDFLLSDTGNSNGLVVIGLYRSNEVGDKHPLTKTIQDLQTKANILNLDITNIQLKSLGVESINKIIMTLLNMDDDDEAKTKGLAEICCRRTLGNPFFVIEFVTMLEMEGLLSFNLGLLKWVWSENEIEKATMSTANVVDLLQARMKKMPEDLQHLMQYAACLGSEFSVSALETIWAHSRYHDAKSSDGLGVSSLLRRLEEGNFIERSSADTCRWLHDKIQEAALSFGLALEETFKFEIGLVLFQNLESRELDKMLFDVTNLINTSENSINAEFAMLNLRAAKKARDSSAFHSAAVFANSGIRLLPSDKWENHNDLAFELYLLGIEMEVAVGNGSKVEEYSKEVLTRSQATLLQKLPIFVANAQKLTNVDRKYDEAIEYLRPIMREFGYWVPGSVMLPFHSLRILRRTLQAAKKMPTSFYEKPRLMTDTKSKAEILILDRITNASYFIHNHLLLMFTTCRMVEITLQNGVSPMSGPAFASLATVTNGILKDRKTALKLAEVALSFFKVVRSRFMESQTLFLTNTHIFCWTNPMSTILTCMRRAYKLACRSGNSEFAMWALHCTDTIYPFHMGKKLGPIATSAAKSVPLMEELGQRSQVWTTRIYWQVVLNLMGEAEDVLVLEGIACNSEEYDKEIGTDAHFEAPVRGAEIGLLLFYGEYKRAAKLALDRSDADTYFGSNLSMYDYFYRCMALYAGARQAKNRRKYSRLANQIRKMIHQWAKGGNPNVKHFDSVLQAEQAALDGKFDVAERQYKEAIKLAARTGHMHHAALFNERYADLLKNRVGFEEEAAYYFKEAIRWYDEWGAVVKVKMLNESVAKANDAV